MLASNSKTDLFLFRAVVASEVAEAVAASEVAEAVVVAVVALNQEV